VNWQDSLRARLQEMQPASVCALDEAARQLAGAALPATPLTVYGRQQESPCALALGIDALNGHSAREAQYLINRVRLYVAPRILLVAQAEGPLDTETLRALGFVLSATDTPGQAQVFYYGLDSYKTVPDWLNARYWAHPERWQP
jgi:hypothetical protein